MTRVLERKQSRRRSFFSSQLEVFDDSGVGVEHGDQGEVILVLAREVVQHVHGLEELEVVEAAVARELPVDGGTKRSKLHEALVVEDSLGRAERVGADEDGHERGGLEDKHSEQIAIIPIVEGNANGTRGLDDALGSTHALGRVVLLERDVQDLVLIEEALAGRRREGTSIENEHGAVHDAEQLVKRELTRKFWPYRGLNLNERHQLLKFCAEVHPKPHETDAGIACS